MEGTPPLKGFVVASIIALTFWLLLAGLVTVLA